MKTTKSNKVTTVKDGKREVIWEDKPSDFDLWFTMPIERARILFYGDKKRKEASQTTYYEDSEKICVGNSIITVNINPYGALYVTRKSNWGFTYTKKTKRVKKWFGKVLSMNDEVFDYLIKKFPTMEFIRTDLPSFKHTVTQCSTTFGKMLSGKITNGKACVKEYLKVHARGMTINVQPVYNWIKDRGKNYDSANLKHMLATARYCKNADALFMRPDAAALLHSYTFRDTLKQARCLNKKIDLLWSHKRLSEVHKLWTREIMAEELKAIEEYNVLYKGELPNFPGFRLVGSQKGVFEIGLMEDHCVYTNYWGKIKEKEYYIIHGMYEGKVYTCGIKCSRLQVPAGDPVDTEFLYECKIDQLQSRRNGGAPAGLKEKIQEWLKRDDVNAFFAVNWKNILPEQREQVYCDVKQMRGNTDWI